MFVLAKTGEIPGRRAELSEMRICGVRALCIVIPSAAERKKRLLARLCRTAAENAGMRGAVSAVFSEGFSGKEFFAEAGIYEASLRPLYEKNAADIAYLAAKRHSCVSVFAGSIMDTEREVIKSLAEKFRYVTLSTGDCRTALVRNIGMRLGASIIENNPGGMLERADAAVFFAPPRENTPLPEKCAALFLDGVRPENVTGGREIENVSFSAPDFVESALPEGFCREALLSQLLVNGAFGAEEIRAASAEMSFA